MTFVFARQSYAMIRRTLALASPGMLGESALRGAQPLTKALLLLVVAWSVSHSAQAQAQAKPVSDQDTDDFEKFTLSGSVRLRFEALEGQFRPGFDDKDDLVSIRTTLLAEYVSGPLRIGAELYDSRVYDTDNGSVLGTSEVNTLELVQAYAALEANDALGTGTNVTTQAGRFTMNLGSRRLVAADDYRNTTNGYTGVRTELKLGSGANATFFYTMPQQRRPDSFDEIRNNRVGFDHEGFDLELWGGFVSKQKIFGKTLGEIAYVRLEESDEPDRQTRNRNLHSVSVRLLQDAAPSAVDYEVEGIYQFGTVRSGTAENAAPLDVAAYFVHADLGYSFAGGWKPRVSVEFDYASGDDKSKSFTRFDTLFGMRRADLAPAGIYAALGRTNLATGGLRAEVTPSAQSDAFMSARALWSASGTDSFSTTGVRDATGASGRFAGYQIEGRIRYWLIPKKLRAEVNAAWLIKRGVLLDAPNATHFGNTRYGSIALTYLL